MSFLMRFGKKQKGSPKTKYVPTSKEGGTCKITTTSGNIDFD